MTQQSLAIFIHFPEFAELAEFLSADGKQTFLDGLKSAVVHALQPQPHVLKIHPEGSASILIAETAKSPFQRYMGFVEAVHKDLRIWTGTFGKIGIPPLKFGMGAVVGEMDVATEWAKTLCPHFEMQVAVEGDLARFAEHPQEWIDVDDVETQVGADGPKTVKRVFTKLVVREDPEDVQILRAARKAYFQNDFVDAKTKFDRISRVKGFKKLSEIYLERLKRRASRK